MLDRTPILEYGVRVPCQRDVPVKLQKGQDLKLQLSNEFVIQQFALEQHKYSSINFSISIDQFYNITVSCPTQRLN